MKTFMAGLIVATACLLFGSSAEAQYKGARNYLAKNSPAPNAGGQTAAPAAPSTQPAAKPQPPKFKDVELNAQFYFLTDTNRAYAWMKLSATTAKNTKNGVTQTIYSGTPIQK